MCYIIQRESKQNGAQAAEKNALAILMTWTEAKISKQIGRDVI